MGLLIKKPIDLLDIELTPITKEESKRNNKYIAVALVCMIVLFLALVLLR